MKDTTPVLHLFGQFGPHAEAFVAGNAAGLIALRDAINEALAKRLGFCEPYCNDGEGYETIVMLMGDTSVSRLATAYQWESAPPANGTAHPWDFVGVKEFFEEKRKQSMRRNDLLPKTHEDSR